MNGGCLTMLRILRHSRSLVNVPRPSNPSITFDFFNAHKAGHTQNRTRPRSAAWLINRPMMVPAAMRHLSLSSGPTLPR